MNDEKYQITPLALLRLQSWISPAFPMGAYSYSHGIERAVAAGDLHDRRMLVEWLEADLRHGSGRNEAIFFAEAWRYGTDDNRDMILEIAELAAAHRATGEFALEASQQGMATLVTLRQVWPDPILDWLQEMFRDRSVPATPAVVLGVRCARQHLPLTLALCAFLQSYTANLVTAGVRLIPLGQTEGQFAIADLEETILGTAAQAEKETINDLGSGAFMVDLASMTHETQYTRLFRS